MVRIARLEQAVSLFVGVPVPQIMEDLVDGVQAVPQELVPNLLGEQTRAVPVPQTKEDVVERTQLAPHVHEQIVEQIGGMPLLSLDQPGDQARRVSADAVYLQGCRLACCDATTGPVTVAQPGDQARRDSADAVHRQSCCRAYCDTATGTTASNCCEDSGIPARAVHRQKSGRACNAAATGPSDSNSGEDGESPARALRQQSRESTCDHADQPGDQARRNPTDSAHRQEAPVPVNQPGDQARRDSATSGDATTGPSGSDRGANGRGPRKRPTEAECAATRKAEATLGTRPSLLTPPSNE